MKFLKKKSELRFFWKIYMPIYEDQCKYNKGLAGYKKVLCELMPRFLFVHQVKIYDFSVKKEYFNLKK